MPEPSMEHYEEFRREVDEVLARQEPLPEFDALASIRKAVSGFDAWWQGEHPAGSEAPSAIPAQVQELSASLEHARRDIQALKASMLAQAPVPQADTAAMTLRDQVRALSADKEALESQSAKLNALAAALQKDLESSRAAAAAAVQENGVLLGKLSEGQRAIASLEMQRTAMEAALNEVRAHAGALLQALSRDREEGKP